MLASVLALALLGLAPLGTQSASAASSTCNPETYGLFQVSFPFAKAGYENTKISIQQANYSDDPDNQGDR